MIVTVCVFMRPVIAGVLVVFVPITDFVTVLMDVEEADHEEGQHHARDDRVENVRVGVRFG
jgi:hypothetical protein